MLSFCVRSFLSGRPATPLEATILLIISAHYTPTQFPFNHPVISELLQVSLIPKSKLYYRAIILSV